MHRKTTSAAVLASVKVRNLKANHSNKPNTNLRKNAVLASVKVRNLKANHSNNFNAKLYRGAVLASVKVRNLKANHSLVFDEYAESQGCISKCEGTKSES